MPYKTNLELFGPVALAHLMDGPKPQLALDGQVPVSVLEHLRTAGMIKRKMLRHGSMGGSMHDLEQFLAGQIAGSSFLAAPGGGALYPCGECGG